MPDPTPEQLAFERGFAAGFAHGRNSMAGCPPDRSGDVSDAPIDFERLAKIMRDVADKAARENARELRAKCDVRNPLFPDGAGTLIGRPDIASTSGVVTTGVWSNAAVGTGVAFRIVTDDNGEAGMAVAV